MIFIFHSLSTCQERGIDTHGGPNHVPPKETTAAAESSSMMPSSNSSSVMIADLRTQNQILADENNLLKLKVEILLDMLAQKTAELDVQESSLLQMKNILANS